MPGDLTDSIRSRRRPGRFAGLRIGSVRSRKEHQHKKEAASSEPLHSRHFLILFIRSDPGRELAAISGGTQNTLPQRPAIGQSIIERLDKNRQVLARREPETAFLEASTFSGQIESTEMYCGEIEMSQIRPKHVLIMREGSTANRPGGQRPLELP